MSLQSPTQVELSFGEQRLALNVSENSLCLIKSDVPSMDDLTTAIKTACDAPLDFPPLPQAIFAGDKVALAVDANIPRIQDFILGLVQNLISNGTSPDDLSVVLSTDLFGVREKLISLLPPNCIVKVHNPDDTAELAYIGAEESAEPIYINRTLVDADVVIPCVICRQVDSFGYGGPGAIVPDFVDGKTQKRFESQFHQGPSIASSDYGNSTAYTLGVLASVVVVPGVDDSIVAIFAGEPNKTMASARERLIEALPNAGTNAYELVIAQVDGDQTQQTWENVARAILTAQASVSKTGSIVVISQLETRVGGALTILAGIDSEDKMSRRITESTLANSAVARTLLDVRSRNPIFLLSRLTREPIESIGLGFVENLKDVERLSKKVDSCLVLGSAQYRSRFEATSSLSASKKA